MIFINNAEIEQEFDFFEGIWYKEKELSRRRLPSVGSSPPRNDKRNEILLFIIMNLDEIKNLIEKDGGKFIIVEDGEPILTVMSFKDYEKIINGYKSNVFEQADSMVEKEKEMEEFEQGIGEEPDEELEPWQKQDNKKEVEEKYPWQSLGDKSEDKDKEETREGLSKEAKSFSDMPIQAKDDETELEDLPVR